MPESVPVAAADEGSVVVGHGLKAVGVGVDGRNQAGVSLEVIFAVAAGERLAIGDKAVTRLKSLQVAGLDFDGNVLESRDLVTRHGVHRAVGRRHGLSLAVNRKDVAIDINKGLAVGIIRRVNFYALGSFDHVGALIAAAMQAVVKGCTGHHVKSALVGLVAGIELARRSGGPCRLHVFTSPILGPRQASVTVGVLVGRRGRRILLVIGSLQGIIDGSLDGVGRDGGSGDGINACSVRLDDLVRHTSDVLACITVFGFVEIVPALASQRIVSLIGDLNGGDLVRGDLYGYLDLVAVDVPLVSACSGVLRVGRGRALIRTICDFGQIVAGRGGCGVVRDGTQAILGAEGLRFLTGGGDRRVVGSFGAGLRCCCCGKSAGRHHRDGHRSDERTSTGIAAHSVELAQHSVIVVHRTSFLSIGCWVLLSFPVAPGWTVVMCVAHDR